ncbi:hypothetical protein ACOSP7_018101 [Xanthoceras sorbifolium]
MRCMECLCWIMGRSLFRREFMCPRSDQTTDDFGSLLHNLVVLLHIVQSGNLPLHRKRTLQDVLGYK